MSTNPTQTTDLEAAVRRWIVAKDAAAEERRDSGLYAPSQLVSRIQTAAATAERELRELMGARPHP